MNPSEHIIDDPADLNEPPKRYGSPLRLAYEGNAELAPFFHLGCAFGLAERLDNLATPSKRSVISLTRDKASRHPNEVMARMSIVIERAYRKAVREHALKRATANLLMRKWNYALSHCVPFPEDLNADQRSAFCLGFHDAQSDADWLINKRSPSVDETAPKLTN